jgi:hypothetical protein
MRFNDIHLQQYYLFLDGGLSFVEQDTFRGRVCECPLVEGVQFHGDGYSLCQGTAELLPDPIDPPFS